MPNFPPTRIFKLEKKINQSSFFFKIISVGLFTKNVPFCAKKNETRRNFRFQIIVYMQKFSCSSSQSVARNLAPYLRIFFDVLSDSCIHWIGEKLRMCVSVFPSIVVQSRHSSRIRCLGSTKCSSETLQILQSFI